MKEEKLYSPEEDPRYAEYYIDEEGWRDTPVRCYFVHGGFPNTEQDGVHVKFCFYYPERDAYEGRFFQYCSPAPEDERESEKTKGEDDRISFALTHGGYFVVSNQGGFVQPMAERCYQANANSARLSREFAKKVYGYDHRPYGYVFGGSGGSFKTMGCIECTNGVWDGAVPYVIANPMATPNVFCPRIRVMRVLGEDGLKKLVDRMDAGGSGDLYEGLEPLQKEALEEATKMGFPKRAWFCWPFMGDGALSVLMPQVYAAGKDYFTDFWTKPGYAGADPNSSEVRDRVQFVTTVKELISREQPKPDENGVFTVDNSWVNAMAGAKETPHIRLAQEPPKDAYLFHSRLRVLSGQAAGTEVSIDEIENGVLKVGAAFTPGAKSNLLEGLAVGDEIMIDNSDFLAMQTFQRHQVPDETYTVYDQYRGRDGKPLYPQFPVMIAPLIAYSGAGTVPTGNIHCKTIALCSLLDESALPWHGDWYRKAVKRATGTEENFRLYYNDNCIHDDSSNLNDLLRQISYVGILRQALLDVAAWAERGVEPPAPTNYTLNDGQIEVPESAAERAGLQPVVHACANGEKSVTVKVGEAVRLTAEIEAPADAGMVSGAVWYFESADEEPEQEPLSKSADGKHAAVETEHIFTRPGTYFPTVKVSASRDGALDDIYVQCRNLDRVRVVVKP